MKNRTLFILLLALSPLGIITFASLLDFFQVPPRSAPDDHALLVEISKESYARQTSAKTSEALCGGLESAHLVVPATSDGAAFVNMAQYEEYRTDVDYMRQWNVILRNQADTLRSLRKIQAKNLSDMENVTPETLETASAATKSVKKAYLNLKRYSKDLQDSMETFVQKNPQTKMSANVQNYVLKVNEMVQLVSERVGRSESIYDAKVMFLDAQQKFEEGNLSECRRLCVKILTKDVLDPAFTQDVRKTSFSARSQMGIQELQTIEESSRRSEDKMDAILELNQKVEDAGKGLKSEQLETLGKEYRAKASELTIKYVEECYTSEITTLMDDLSATPPESFVQSLHDAQTIVDKINQMEKKMRYSADSTQTFPQIEDLRKTLREIVTQLLDAKLPNEAESNQDIQEAEMRDGSIQAGYFREVKENGKTIGFKIYDSYEEYENPTGSKGITSIDEFHVLPGPSLEARSAEKYIDARKELMRDLGKRAAWNVFSDKCSKIEKELADWEEKSGVTARFSVKNPLAIAKGTLKNENWDIMNNIF